MRWVIKSSCDIAACSLFVASTAHRVDERSPWMVALEKYNWPLHRFSTGFGSSNPAQIPSYSPTLLDRLVQLSRQVQPWTAVSTVATENFKYSPLQSGRR